MSLQLPCRQSVAQCTVHIFAIRFPTSQRQSRAAGLAIQQTPIASKQVLPGRQMRSIPLTSCISRLSVNIVQIGRRQRYAELYAISFLGRNSQRFVLPLAETSAGPRGPTLLHGYLVGTQLPLFPCPLVRTTNIPSPFSPPSDALAPISCQPALRLRNVSELLSAR